jgi:tetratricopeptide (TPR) repeat protein
MPTAASAVTADNRRKLAYHNWHGKNGAAAAFRNATVDLGARRMRLSLLCVALPLIALGIPPACASDLSGRSWEDCLKAPDRDCVLNEAMNQVYLLDRTDRRAALVAVVSETLAKAGEIDQATQLSTQIPDRLLARIAVEREIAVAQARALHHKEAEAAFDRALQLAYGSKDALERAEALYSIADSQANAGMKSAADLTFDQALDRACPLNNRQDYLLSRREDSSDIKLRKLTYVQRVEIPLWFGLLLAILAPAADEEAFRLSENHRISCTRGHRPGKLSTATCKSYAYVFNVKTSEYFRCSVALALTRDDKEVINIHTDGACVKKPRVFDNDSSYSFDATETEPPNTNSIFGTGGYAVWASDNAAQSPRLHHHQFGAGF